MNIAKNDCFMFYIIATEFDGTKIVYAFKDVIETRCSYTYLTVNKDIVNLSNYEHRTVHLESDPQGTIIHETKRLGYPGSPVVTTPTYCQKTYGGLSQTTSGCAVGLCKKRFGGKWGGDFCTDDTNSSSCCVTDSNAGTYQTQCKNSYKKLVVSDPSNPLYPLMIDSVAGCKIGICDNVLGVASGGSNPPWGGDFCMAPPGPSGMTCCVPRHNLKGCRSDTECYKVVGCSTSAGCVGVCMDNLCQNGEKAARCNYNSQCNSVLADKTKEGVCMDGFCQDGLKGSRCNTDGQCVAGGCLDGKCTTGKKGERCDRPSQCVAFKNHNGIMVNSCLDGFCATGEKDERCDTDTQCVAEVGGCMDGFCTAGKEGERCDTDNQCVAGVDPYNSAIIGGCIDKRCSSGKLETWNKAADILANPASTCYTDNQCAAFDNKDGKGTMMRVCIDKLCQNGHASAWDNYIENAARCNKDNQCVYFTNNKNVIRGYCSSDNWCQSGGRDSSVTTTGSQQRTSICVTDDECRKSGGYPNFKGDTGSYACRSARCTCISGDCSRS